MAITTNPLDTVVPSAGGVTIQRIVANGITQSSGTQITRGNGNDVVLVTTTDDPDNYAVVLPPDPHLGDMVEIYCVTPWDQYDDPILSIFPAPGMQIGQLGVDVPMHLACLATTMSLNGGSGLMFRYIDPNQWYVIGGG